MGRGKGKSRGNPRPMIGPCGLDGCSTVGRVDVCYNPGVEWTETMANNPRYSTVDAINMDCVCCPYCCTRGVVSGVSYHSRLKDFNPTQLKWKAFVEFTEIM